MTIGFTYKNQVFYKSSENMEELPDNSVHLIVTSPPYFNIKNYSKDDKQIGNINHYPEFISSLIPIWKECHRVLVPNGKMAINTSLMPMLKNDSNTHYNRDILNINSDIEHSILSNIPNFYQLDLYIWNRTNSTKSLMFGSYPYPSNFYAQNTIEFINVYVKGGKPQKVPKEIKEKSKLTSKQWREYTKQIWDIHIPNKKDIAYGQHSAIMPEEIVKRCINLYSFIHNVVLDPFAGSGTTLKVAIEEKRNYVGYEISEKYKNIIESKIDNAITDIFEEEEKIALKKERIILKEVETNISTIDIFDEEEKIALKRKILNNSKIKIN